MTYQLKEGSILSNEVNDMTPRQQKLHQYLLEWLLNNGMDKVRRNKVWNQGDWEMAQSCILHGYLNSIQEPKSFNYYHALTDKGLEFLNKGEKHEQ